MTANLGVLMLLAGCDEPDAPNPFDDWGPYKHCEQVIVYTGYDVSDAYAEPYPAGYNVDVYTAQGGLLQREQYDSDYTLTYTTICSYDDRTHAPLGCDAFYEGYHKPYLYYTEDYGYRADGLQAWALAVDFSSGSSVLYTSQRDESDRVVRVDTDFANPDAWVKVEIDGVPDWSDVWIYDGPDTLPSKVERYDYDDYDGAYLIGVVLYTVEDDQIVRTELVTPDGEVTEVHDFTYDDDGNLLTDVRDGGLETYTYTYDDRGFVVTGTHEIAWNDLSDVRTDWTAAITYDCEVP